MLPGDPEVGFVVTVAVAGVPAQVGFAIQEIFKAKPLQFVEPSERKRTVNAPVVEVIVGTVNVVQEVPLP